MQLTGRALFIAASAALIGTLTSCSVGPASSSSSSNGTVSFSMTDAASDDIESFTVDVTQVQLKQASGALVNVISAPVTVDLAALTDLTQLMNSVNVPPGLYNSASITFDFTNASCVLEGSSVPAAILDDNGVAVTGTLTLPMQFGQHDFKVVGDKQRLLEFDFDLNQSMDVDLLANTVKLEPAIVLHMDGSGKKLVTLGQLISVNTADSTFVASVKTLHGVDLGHVTCETAPSTIFQVDGVPSMGSTGLALLATKPAGTSIQVHGVINPDSARLLPDSIECGAGTFNGGTDIVEGLIVDRIGNPGAGADVTLTVRGHSNNSTHNIFQFDTAFTIDTSFANTKVVRRDSALAFDLDDLNVGQHLRIFGTLSGTTMDATSAASVIREQPTRAFGHANSAISSGTLTMNLSHVDLRPQTDFLWADSGSTAPVPTSFKVKTGTLGNGLGVTNGTSVEARGFLAPIDDINQDFVATSLTNLDKASSLLFVKNLPGGFSVSASAFPAEIQLNITGAAAPGEKAIIDRGFAGVTALPTSPVPNIHSAAASGVFIIRDKVTGSETVFLAFSPFSTALGNVLALGATIKTFGAIGIYDAATNAVQATVVNVIVE